MPPLLRKAITIIKMIEQMPKTGADFDFLAFSKPLFIDAFFHYSGTAHHCRWALCLVPL
jgi:hypothetical protein